MERLHHPSLCARYLCVEAAGMFCLVLITLSRRNRRFCIFVQPCCLCECSQLDTLPAGTLVKLPCSYVDAHVQHASRRAATYYYMRKVGSDDDDTSWLPRTLFFRFSFFRSGLFFLFSAFVVWSESVQNAILPRCSLVHSHVCSYRTPTCRQTAPLPYSISIRI